MSCRDDFQTGISSLFADFSSQGWFPAMKCILISKKVLSGMIPSEENHPDLKEMSCRDDFQRRNASWLARKSCQGWFPVEKIILISRKCLAGMISRPGFHLYLQISPRRDDSQRWNASWLARKSCQGWFPARKIILIWRKCLAGMISSGEMHPD